MELFLFHPDQYHRLYNCSRIPNLDAIPLEQRRHPAEAIGLLVLSAIYYPLYIPCLYAIWKHAGRDNGCYMLLFFISICDMSILWIIGPLHAWFALNGVVFCSHPTFIYICGVMSCEVLWTIESTADTILALNRCVDALSPHYSHLLFAGRRIHLWLALPLLYGCRNFFFSMPAVYSNSIWFFNPYIGYIEDTDGIYVNIVHSAHNIFIAISNPAIYALFLAIMLVKIRKYGTAGGSSYSEMMNSVVSSPNPSIPPLLLQFSRQIFFQVFAMSALNTVASSMYIYMQFVNAPEALMLIGHFAWFHIHGFPPVIYLLMNPTIRNETKILCKKLLCMENANRASNRVSAAITTHAQ